MRQRRVSPCLPSMIDHATPPASPPASPSTLWPAEPISTIRKLGNLAGGRGGEVAGGTRSGRGAGGRIGGGGELAAGGGDLPAPRVAHRARDAGGVYPAHELALHRLRRGVPPAAGGRVQRDDVDVNKRAKL